MVTRRSRSKRRKVSKRNSKRRSRRKVSKRNSKRRSRRKVSKRNSKRRSQQKYNKKQSGGYNTLANLKKLTNLATNLPKNVGTLVNKAAYKNITRPSMDLREDLAVRIQDVETKASKKFRPNMAKEEKKKKKIWSAEWNLKNCEILATTVPNPKNKRKPTCERGEKECIKDFCDGRVIDLSSLTITSSEKAFPHKNKN